MKKENKAWKKQLLLGLLAIGTMVGKAQDATLKINQIQVIGSHNSYRKSIEPGLLANLQAMDSSRDLSGLAYTHIPVLQQLDMGLRNLEIDIYADQKGGRYAHPKGLDITTPMEAYDPEGLMLKPGFKVFHMPDVDFKTWYYTFVALLRDLRTWSLAHPEHEPIFITLEPKDGKGVLGAVPEKFTSQVFDEVDQTIRKYLGVDQLISPDEVRGSYPTLEAAVLQHNWPTLATAKGKFMFLLDDNGQKREEYLEGHPSLKGRAIFVNAMPGQAAAAILFRNDPEDQSIPELAKKGYIIRTRADADTREARKNDYTRFHDAEKSGAQVITTDYYQPSTLFDSPYHIVFENGKYVRVNPVTGNQ